MFHFSQQHNIFVSDHVVPRENLVLYPPTKFSHLPPVPLDTRSEERRV